MDKENASSSHTRASQKGKEKVAGMEEILKNVLQEIASTEAFANLWDSGAIQEEMERIEHRMKSGAYALSHHLLFTDLQQICKSVRERGQRIIDHSDALSELTGYEEEPEPVCCICTVGEREDDDLIQCSNEDCQFKYYHTRCMRPPMASAPMGTSWYCPACLCRVCFLLVENAPTILCGGCSDCYHTYCVYPHPEENWVCARCMEWQNRLANSPAIAIEDLMRRRVHSNRVIP